MNTKRRGRPRKLTIERQMVHEREHIEDAEMLIDKQIKATIILICSHVAPLSKQQETELAALLKRLVRTVRQLDEHPQSIDGPGSA